jgi:hypothetical protein
MRVLIKAKIPHESFNAAVRDGSAGQKTQRILDEMKPEAVYFTEMEGHRTVVMVVDLKEASQIPAYAEPLFLTFNASVSFHPAMTQDDLAKADLEAIGKKWG